MSTRLLNAHRLGEPTIHTPLDDLESFLWLLIWGIVHASKDIEGAMAANRGIKLMLDAWKSEGGVDSNRTKLSTAENEWSDVVFGGLIDEWLTTLRTARKDKRQLIEHLPTIAQDQGTEWNQACDHLESYCIGIYESLLESGFGHLVHVGTYSDWSGVVIANVEAKKSKGFLRV